MNQMTLTPGNLRANTLPLTRAMDEIANSGVTGNRHNHYTT